MRPVAPPNSPEAERSVLGACLYSKEALGSVMEILTPEDFYTPANKSVFEVLSDMYHDDKPADIITLSEELKARGILDRLGGQAFVTGLSAGLSTTANAGYHATIIRENSVRRQLIEAGSKIQELALQPEKDTQSVIEEAEQLLFRAAMNRSASDFRHVREIIGPVVAEVEESYKQEGTKISGYRTGFSELDAYTGGLKPGSLTIIAARPSMGKTAFALNIAQFGGKKGENLPVLIFSVEMPAEQLVLRMLAAEAQVNLSMLNTGTFNTDDYKRLNEACKVLAGRNIYINDANDLSAMDFRTRCRRFKNRHPDLGLVVVDYLQLMNSGSGRGFDGRQQEVADISRMLKAAAREINCPVIALSQLSRSVEQRPEKKPMLSDLRDSGAIEQDADVVLLMFRKDYYSEEENNDLTHSNTDIRVAKNRNGSTGVFHIVFQREYTRFRNKGDGF
ncbi:MAG: replicative DNA helicase [Synergistaceae bacterium]|nr:replicative DNA helicase [Synergistaceae bacterium]